MDNRSKEDILYLGEKFSFHQLNLDHCPSKSQLSKIDAYDGYIFCDLRLSLVVKNTV